MMTDADQCKKLIAARAKDSLTATGEISGLTSTIWWSHDLGTLCHAYRRLVQGI